MVSVHISHVTELTTELIGELLTNLTIAYIAGICLQAVQYLLPGKCALLDGVVIVST